MIFVTLGSQKFQFNRLLKAIDEFIVKKVIKDNVFAQTGYSDYIPQNYKFKQFLDRNSFTKIMKQSDIVITHGGTGAIVGAIKNGKKVIAVPRKAQYGEHVDDHQIQIVRQFENMDMICMCDDCMKIGEALEYVKLKDFKNYQSNTQNIISNIEKFIEGQIV